MNIPAYGKFNFCFLETSGIKEYFFTKIKKDKECKKKL